MWQRYARDSIYEWDYVLLFSHVSSSLFNFLKNPYIVVPVFIEDNWIWAFVRLCSKYKQKKWKLVIMAMVKVKMHKDLQMSNAIISERNLNLFILTYAVNTLDLLDIPDMKNYRVKMRRLARDTFWWFAQSFPRWGRPDGGGCASSWWTPPCTLGTTSRMCSARLGISLWQFLLSVGFFSNVCKDRTLLRAIGFI